jgi:hypothetical protein
MCAINVEPIYSVSIWLMEGGGSILSKGVLSIWGTDKEGEKGSYFPDIIKEISHSSYSVESMCELFQ